MASIVFFAQRSSRMPQVRQVPAYTVSWLEFDALPRICILRLTCPAPASASTAGKPSTCSSPRPHGVEFATRIARDPFFRVYRSPPAERLDRAPPSSDGHFLRCVTIACEPHYIVSVGQTTQPHLAALLSSHWNAFWKPLSSLCRKTTLSSIVCE